MIGAGKAALTASLLVGLTAVHPVLGAVAAHAYSAYNHGVVGLGLYNIFKKWKSGEESTPQAAKETTKLVAGEVAGRPSDRLAETMVSGLKQTGGIEQVAKQTSISPVVYSDMLQGSISSSASQGFGDLAGYMVGKAVGAP